MGTPPDKPSGYSFRILRSCKGPKAPSRPHPALPELPRGARSSCVGFAALMEARRLSRHSKAASIRPPLRGQSGWASPPPHASPPSPCSTASRPVARVAQSYKSGEGIHWLARPVHQMTHQYLLRPAGRLGVAGRTAWERHALLFPAPRGHPGSFLAFAQMPVSLDGRAWANFDVDELRAPARRRPGQLLSDRMLLLSGRKLPLHPRSPIGNPLPATGPALIGLSTKPRQRGQHLGQEIRSAPSVGSGSFGPGSG